MEAVVVMRVRATPAILEVATAVVVVEAGMVEAEIDEPESCACRRFALSRSVRPVPVDNPRR